MTKWSGESFVADSATAQGAARVGLMLFTMMLARSVLPASAASPQVPSTVRPSAQLYVDQLIGDDSADGTENKPLKSLEKARDLGAQLSRSTDLDGNAQFAEVEIIIRGTYRLSQPLVFKPEHSGTERTPVIFRGTVVPSPKRLRDDATRKSFRNEIQSAITGAMTFSHDHGGRWEEVPTVASGGTPNTSSKVWVFQFDQANNNQLSERIRSRAAERTMSLQEAEPALFTQLYVGHSRRPRARYPNQGSRIVGNTWPFDKNAGTGQRAAVLVPRIFPLQAGSQHDLHDRLLDKKTELVFTRSWQQARGIIKEWWPQSSNSRNIALGLYGFEKGQEGWLGEVHPTSNGADYDSEFKGSRSDQWWNRAYLENNKAFLDAPGEWYFDEATVQLFYIPLAEEKNFPLGSETGKPIEFQLPVLSKLIDFQGKKEDLVRHIRFKGLEFKFTSWTYENGASRDTTRTRSFHGFMVANYGQVGAIDGNYLSNVEFQFCFFRALGSGGISLGGHRSDYIKTLSPVSDGSSIAHALTINENLFEDLGASAIRLHSFVGEGDILNGDVKSAISRVRSTIRANYISEIGRIFNDSPGVVVMKYPALDFINNTISNTPYSGASFGWSREPYPRLGGHYIAGNKITGAMSTLIDGANLYLSGSRGVLRNNYLRGLDACSRPLSKNAFWEPNPIIGDERGMRRSCADLYFDWRVGETVNSTGIGYFNGGGNFIGKLKATPGAQTTLKPL